MSFVYYLNVYDPIALPVGSSKLNAAEVMGARLLSAPSEKLVNLLTRVREELHATGINVVGGNGQLPVVWEEGTPPKVSGGGANCALWTLIFPEDDHSENILDIVQKIIEWAKRLGLGVFDPQQDLFERHAQAEKAQIQSVIGRREQTEQTIGTTPAGCTDILLIDPLGFFQAGVFTSFAKSRKNRAEMSLREVCDHWMSGRKLDGPYEIRIKLLIQGLLDVFPFDAPSTEHAIWCGRHPWNDPVFQSDAVRMIRVATPNINEVLRHLLPLARETFVTVVVPEMDFYVSRSQDPENFAAHPMEMLKALDPDWERHRLPEAEGLAKLGDALSNLLTPLGFVEIADDVGYPARTFERPMLDGQVRHLISLVSSRLHAEVRSQRCYDNCVIPSGMGKKLYMAAVVILDLKTVQERNDPSWLGGGGPGMTWSDLSIAITVADVEHKLLPKIDPLTTAESLWHWYQQEYIAGSGYVPLPGHGVVPKVKDWKASIQWLRDNPLKHDSYRYPNYLSKTLYAARCLPDADFFPMLDDWLSVFDPSSMNGTSRAERFAAALRVMPQTPMDAPL